jgi:AcrR family transcriptional regulator
MAAKLTSEKIATAARQLLDKEGEEAVTMRRVAAAVGITPMAVYRHYPDRLGLLNALADEGFQELSGRLAGRLRADRLTSDRPPYDLEKRLRKVLDLNLDFALENPRLFELMFLKPRKGSRQYPRDFKAGKSPTANRMADLIQEGMDTGYFRQDDLWEIVLEIGALLQGLVMLYLGGRIAISPARFRSLCHRSFRRYFDGIRK